MEKIKKNKYQDELIQLLGAIRPKFFSTHKIEFKNVFGAVGGYVDGNIFISCGKFGVALRLPQKALEVLFKENGTKHLKYFPKGHIKREYIVLPKRILHNKDQFKKLLDKSVWHVNFL